MGKIPVPVNGQETQNCDGLPACLLVVWRLLYVLLNGRLTWKTAQEQRAWEHSWEPPASV